MKKTLFLGCLAALSMGYADETEAHRVTFGADGYYIGTKGFHKDGEIDHKATAIARGVKWSYDYIKANSFYAGASGVLQIGRINQRVVYFNFPYMDGDKEAFTDLTIKNRYALEGRQAEARMGATLQTIPELTITPFGGLSVRSVRIKSLNPQVFSLDSSVEQATLTTNTFEFLIGANSEYSYSEQFKTGLGIKRYQCITGRVHGSNGSVSFSDSRPLWEMSLPLSYFFVCNAQDTFNVTLEPYLRKQFGTNRETAKGARLTLACDF